MPPSDTIRRALEARATQLWPDGCTCTNDPYKIESSYYCDWCMEYQALIHDWEEYQAAHVEYLLVGQKGAVR